MRFRATTMACLGFFAAYQANANANDPPSYCNFPTGALSVPDKYMHPPTMAIGDSV
jgi:hypothetical protein